MLRHLQIVALTVFSCTFGIAQILPSRNLLADPLADTSGTFGLLSRSHFYGELARGFNSAGDDRAWDATIGGFVDLFRWDSGTALRARLAQDLFGNSLTHDIHFKARAMEYEENISGVFHNDSFDWELGASYRCKHDIDNTDNPTSSVTPAIDSIPQKRVLILGGLYGVISPDPILLAPSLLLKGFARADYYLVHEDNRFPANADGMLWSNVRASMTLGARLDFACLSKFSLYTFDWFNPVFATGAGPNAESNERVEAGGRFAGAFGGLSVFVAFEHWFDDLSIPVPRESNVVSVGLRIN
jgi:hypothetical protein